MNEVEEVKTKLDLVEVIGSYVTLKQAGRNFKALSPFKAEKTPSFVVSPEKGIWHDFSSGEGGDVFSFIMKMEGVDFSEALEMMARRAGVTLQRRSRGPGTKIKQRIYEATAEALAYYHVSLSKNKNALSYLSHDRGIKSAAIKTYKLGYAPDSWDGLSKYLLSRGYNEKELQQAGLIGMGKQGQFDIFRGRIMFPIFDMQNRPIGFSARTLDSTQSTAKYINTPTTPIYNKSLAIYGLAQAKESIRNANEVLLVEGNMDVIGLHQVGITNVVAVSGTALSVQQLKSLHYLAETIIICFDSDNAGHAATKRAIELAAELGISVKVITLSDSKDPDELIKNNPKQFQMAYKSASTGLEYLFAQASTLFDISTGGGKRKYSDFILPAVIKLADPIEQDHYIKKLTQILEVNEQSIRAKISSDDKENKNIAEQVTEEPQTSDPQIVHENRLLELILAYPELRDALNDIPAEAISAKNHSLVNTLKDNPEFSTKDVVKHLPDRANDVKVLTLRGEQHFSATSEHDRRMEAYTQAHLLRTYQLKIARAKLTRSLAEAERTGDIKKRDQILAQIQDTIKEDF